MTRRDPGRSGSASLGKLGAMSEAGAGAPESGSGPARTAQLVAGGANVGGGVYGTVLVLAVIGAWYADPTSEALETLISVLLTVAVFWIAHAYSHVVAHGVARGRASPAEIRASLADDWPIVQVAAAPGLALALGALGLIGQRAALVTAIVVAVAQLLVFGLLMARTGGRSWPRALAVAAVLGALGLLVAGLEISLG